MDERPRSTQSTAGGNNAGTPDSDINSVAAQADRIARLQALLSLQADVRKASSEKELTYIIANDSRNIIQARQIFVLRNRGRAKFEVVAISALAEVERNAPLVRAIETLTGNIASQQDFTKPQTFNLVSAAVPDEPDLKTYPFGEFLWIPLSSNGLDSFAGMLLARERVWQNNETTVGEHLAEIYAYAWSHLVGRRRLAGSKRPRWLVPGLAGLAIVALGFLPVSLTTLAPAQITSRNAVVISAPIDGIVDDVLVDPNSVVQEGQPVIRYVDDVLRNDVELARRKVDVALAREKQLTHGAFADAGARHQLKIAQSELALAEGELTYSRELLSQTVVAAPSSGVAIYEDRDDWKGRPVKAGLRILRVADPSSMELEIELPVSDAIVANEGSRVRFFLDTSPLDPIEAKLVRTSYQAVRTGSEVLAYTLVAELQPGTDDAGFRIGLRGVAQVFGEDVSLFFFLFRKPIASLRQYIGY